MFRNLWKLTKQAVVNWSNDDASSLAAALAYYTIFSIAPVLVIVIAIAGFALGREAVEGQLQNQIQGLVGVDGAHAIQAMIRNASEKKSSGVIAAILGLVTLIFGASGVFGQLQRGLNAIWAVTPKPGRGIRGILRDRFASFAMLAGIAFILLASLVASAAVAAINEFVSGLLPAMKVLMSTVELIVSFGITTVLFAMIFKVLPDVTIGWRDVWVGAAATALLFTIGKFLIGLYLGQSSVTSSYGAAGSLVIVLLWVYYSAQILFLGAEFTRAYANEYGSRIEPAANAIAVEKTMPPAEDETDRNRQDAPAKRSA